jgi:alpha-N-arabinofuranosidase
MKKAKCIIDKDYKIAAISDNLYSSFIEHVGRAVYTGIYEPGHPQADEQGFRKDVLSMVRELGISLVRYPGGNFLSGYNWTDGIGPRKDRPRRLDYAWRSIEPNEIGIDEFTDWCKKAGTRLMAAVNLGTGTPQDAGYMIEYCNHPGGTYWSDKRKEYGYKNPHKIKYWCLGNEMDGPWQIGQLSADEYGKKAREAAKIMRWVDPDIKLIACGSSTTWMPTYPEWDRIVLEHLYEHVDYISLHRYYENEGSVADFLASFVDMNDFIHTISSTADYIKAKNRSKKTLMLSFDEWNVWYQKKQTRMDWQTAPPILEDIYSLLDALVFGGMLCTLLNNADRVKIACLAQLVNVIAPIYTKKGGMAIKQTIYYPFKQVSLYGRGNALKTIVDCPVFETSNYSEAPLLQTAATHNKETGEVSIFILNCDQEEAVEMDLDIRSFGNLECIEHLVMSGSDIRAQNTFDKPGAVIPVNQKLPASGDDGVTLVLSALSWNVIRLKSKHHIE